MHLSLRRDVKCHDTLRSRTECKAVYSAKYVDTIRCAYCDMYCDVLVTTTHELPALRFSGLAESRARLNRAERASARPWCERKKTVKASCAFCQTSRKIGLCGKLYLVKTTCRKLPTDKGSFRLVFAPCLLPGLDMNARGYAYAYDRRTGLVDADGFGIGRPIQQSVSRNPKRFQGKTEPWSPSFRHFLRSRRRCSSSGRSVIKTNYIHTWPTS